MTRKPFPLLALALAALACALLPGRATPEPGAIETSAAATLTALAPPPTAAPATEAPTATSEATPTAAAPEATATLAPDACAVAYADGPNLYCLDAAGTPQLLASAGLPIDQPRISPDGQLVAYTVLLDSGAGQLWVAPAQPGAGEPRLLVSAENVPNSDPTLINSPRSYAWRPGTHTLIFDTRYTPTGGPFGPGEYINADLWAVDADTGTVTSLLPPDSAGLFAVSPNGAFVAIARSDRLSLVNADGSNFRDGVITFPNILTYSEYFFRPEPVWSPDSTFFTVLIPSADPMAADPSADLYRVGADGIVTPLSTVPGNFVFGGTLKAKVSPDGQYVAYSMVVPGDSSRDVVYVRRTDGAGELALEPVPVPLGWGWSPDSQRFAYSSAPGGPGSGYVTGVTPESVQPWGAGLTAVLDLQWLDNSTFYFIGQFGGDWGLYRQTLGADPVLIAPGLTQGARLDVR